MLYVLGLISFNRQLVKSPNGVKCHDEVLLPKALADSYICMRRQVAAGLFALAACDSCLTRPTVVNFANLKLV